MNFVGSMQLEYIDHMGDDNSVVNAARVSFAKDASKYTKEENTKLIRYLAKHKHEIPFAHTAITVRVKAPISIRTQCFKSKIGFVESEVSRRYVKDAPKVYTPEFRKALANVKQGSSDELHEDNDKYEAMYEEVATQCIALYEDMIAKGVAPEVARFILPQGTMTEWVWTGSLLAFARFYNLRSDKHAQKEVREIALMVGFLMEKLFPVSWNALTNWSEVEV